VYISDSNLVPEDTNGRGDVLVRDVQAGTTKRVSVDSAGSQSNDTSKWPTVSVDGRFVAFMSNASNLVPGDTNGVFDIFVHDTESGLTERVSVSSAGNQGNSRRRADRLAVAPVRFGSLSLQRSSQLEAS
jgi:Tol biopolymer transport system component